MGPCPQACATSPGAWSVYKNYAWQQSELQQQLAAEFGWVRRGGGSLPVGACDGCELTGGRGGARGSLAMGASD